MSRRKRGYNWSLYLQFEAFFIMVSVLMCLKWEIFEFLVDLHGLLSWEASINIVHQVARL